MMIMEAKPAPQFAFSVVLISCLRPRPAGDQSQDKAMPVDLPENFVGSSRDGLVGNVLDTQHEGQWPVPSSRGQRVGR